MEVSKIRLSTAEMKLFGDAKIILTKNTILQKTVLLLSDVQEALVREAEVQRHCFSSSAKISKGENYSGLPYVILDYPRTSAGDDLLFIRSMFWWGNFFSSTLQLSGTYKEKSKARLIDAYDTLSTQTYFIGVNEAPWIHHFEADNYRRISELSREAFTKILEERPYTKIAAHWPLSDWDTAASKLFESWKLLMQLLG